MKFALSKLKTAQEFCELKKTFLASKKIVFTNGCFDILHTGHLTYLNQAASLGDILVIGLNSDKSIKRLKGEDRPINSETDRVIALGALAFVDYIIIFDEDTPLELIKTIQPNILVKGADYEISEIVGAREVIESGGEVKTIKLVEGKSTTNIISKIKNLNSRSISIMVPALNESENLAKILDNIITNLSENNVKFELILINDGSSDNTGEIMDNFKNQYPEKIKVIHHQTNRGLGRSFREALNIAENECFTWFPSDGENDINDLIKYLPLLNYVDIIIPFAVNKGVRSIFRRILSSCYLMIINITFGTMFNYTNGNVIYKKKFLKKLRLTSNSFFFQTEALIKATRLNRNEIMFAEVPIILKKRASGKSQAFRLNNVINIFIDYLKLVFDIHIIDRFTGKYKGIV